jgi:hypothetical protein
MFHIDPSFSNILSFTTVLRQKKNHTRIGMVLFGFGGDAQTRTGDGDFADLCLTTWLRRRVRKTLFHSASACGESAISTKSFLLLPKKQTCFWETPFPNGKKILTGAGNEARTRYLHLGKVALYQMSYARI